MTDQRMGVLLQFPTPCTCDRFALTPRELDVLSLVAEGYTNRAIGRLLFLGQQTVKNLMATAAAKLRANNRVEAILLAHAHGLLNLNDAARRCAARLDPAA